MDIRQSVSFSNVHVYLTYCSTVSGSGLQSKEGKYISSFINFQYAAGDKRVSLAHEGNHCKQVHVVHCTFVPLVIDSESSGKLLSILLKHSCIALQKKALILH